jgi:D-alanyl-D-alanine carboxypeptidase
VATLVYSPGVAIIIDSVLHGPIDVSEDASVGSVTLRENGSHSVNITLENANRKYDGLFVPNDRIIIQMKRFRWMQVMAGYLNRSPYFSAYARQVNVSATCTLKVLKYWPWDRGSSKANALIFGKRNTTAQDGGISDIVTTLMTTVTNWEKDRIHIGRVPEEWVAKYQQVYMRIDQETAQTLEASLGVNPLIGGEPVGLFPISSAPRNMTGHPMASTVPSGTDAQLESMLIEEKDYDVVLGTIRAMESGGGDPAGDYKAVNKGDGSPNWATGAYQFLDTTWGKFQGSGSEPYSRAYLAPPVVQDEKANLLVRWIVSHYGKKLLNIPYGWYYPAVFKDPSWLDKTPAKNEGNTLTLRQYGYKWANTYIRIYNMMRGTAPVTPTAGTVIQTAGSTVSGVRYPIPAGKTSLSYTDVGWGGWENGKIPATAMSHTPRTLYGHALAVQSWNELCDEAEKLGYDVRGGMYRSAEAQAQVGAMGAPVGHSNHGWGLAIDINVLVGSYSKKYPKVNNTAMYDTPEYKWLAANAWKFGWLNPISAQKGGKKPEAWHWEFVAFYTYKDGNNPLTEGTSNAFPNSTDAAALGDFANPSASQLFNIIGSWLQDPSETTIQSDTLWGYRALMNDEPIMVTIDGLIKASARSYCAAPNGDFISWFPDYWGEYGLAGAMEIETVELKDFTVDWDDESLITHQYVEGASYNFSTGSLPTGIMDALHAFTTRGIVTADMPGILEAIFNVKDARQYPWLKDAKSLFQRFGARVDYNRNPMIYGPEQEFWAALGRFTRAWAAQFSTTVPLTFMPELFPGMLIRIPFFKVQMYVTSVTHRWDYNSGGGFSTDIGTMAISSTDGSGFYLFPKGGDVLQMPGPDFGEPTPFSSSNTSRAI